ncbi:hypothetical protein EB796_005844 [Bugula neritina]|uniref:BTB domain-containing protein n=1 Tax=Bugula neritina TaxID=10212 RepID=A0A7J7KE78_BUGNE|nr:hypothetical protein EB796_005844 [Bugula neritina]
MDESLEILPEVEEIRREEPIRISGYAQRIVINVSGRRFITTRETLSKYPHTTLGKLLSDNEGTEYFFDADEEVFREVLRYHRTGELHVPQNMCYQTFTKQLQFWGVEKSAIEDCCQQIAIDKTDEEMEKEFLWFERRIELERELRWRDRVWYFMTDPMGPYTRWRKASIVWTGIYCLMVVIQSVNIAVATSPRVSEFYLNNTDGEYYDTIKELISKDSCKAIHNQNRMLRNGHNIKGFVLMYITDHACFVYFTIEMVIRFICCPKKRAFLCSINFLDMMITIAQATEFVISFLIKEKVAIQHLGAEGCTAVNYAQIAIFLFIQLRSIRLFKIVTICSQLQVLVLAIYTSWKEICLLAVTIVISCLICAPLVFYSELLEL